MPNTIVNTGPTVDNSLTTSEVTDTFAGYIAKADGALEAYMNDPDHLDASGALDLSASESLEFQKLMSAQSIAAQTGTSTLKTLKDSIIAAARNI
ncbi:hypothetical protein IG557_17510 [Vibrio cholerae]|uniref:hypothetical protein n=1 Tax=Vibrio cholerae TaxID=666 RepID=UPI002271F3C9|nr:hypothetical protein [Vibrio cholerae]MCX9560633.1 hypothetical protein [Vibrio cholerae]MCX9560966.1 hypothetical protein [Vibrio cholerae]